MSLTVGDLVAYLDARIPFAWAEPWDGIGLLVGDPAAPLTRVFVSLDPTHAALEAARAASAQVLLTHHPAFIEAPERVCAAPGSAGVPFAAARAGIALVSCHTNLDRAPEGADALPALLGARVMGPVEPLAPGEELARPGAPDSGVARMGRVCDAAPAITVAELAGRVGGALGVRTTVWGDPARPVSRFATAPGSGRSLVAHALAAGCDAVVTGEMRYHEARDAVDAGLAVIEAGHDATEWPLTRALAVIAADLPGLGEAGVVMDRVAYAWSTI